MSEFITIQVGQCGNQIGTGLWPSILEEYGIQSLVNGASKVNQSNNNKCSANNELLSSFNSFFAIPPNKTCSSLNSLSDLKQAKIKARSILVDMEDSVVARYKTGPLRDIFDDKCIVTNYPGSGNNWAEGFCHHGPNYKDKLLKSISRAIDKCDSLQGFLLMFSVGGGTGSGLGTYILQLLDDYYPDVERFVSCVYPTGTEDVITCPYNMVLSTNKLMEHASCIFPVENRALLDIVSRQYNNRQCSATPKSTIVEFKPFHDMNNVIVDMLLHLTSGSRFPGSLNVDINEISTNMVPYPNMHFLSSSFSPVISHSLRTNNLSSQSVRDEIFRTASSKNNQLLKIDPLGVKSVLLGSTLIGRGNFCISDMRNYVEKLQMKGHYTNWSKKSVKVGLCNIPPTKHNAAMLTLFNSTAITTMLSHIHELFDKLYKKKAHVHHYTQVGDFEEDSFEESRSNLLSTIDLYKQMESCRQKP